MNFKQWLAEWEGFGPATGDTDGSEMGVNGPQYPRSKYKGKGHPDPEPEVRGADFGFSPDDPLLKSRKFMRKMKKMKGR